MPSYHKGWYVRHAEEIEVWFDTTTFLARSDPDVVIHPIAAAKLLIDQHENHVQAAIRQIGTTKGT